MKKNIRFIIIGFIVVLLVAAAAFMSMNIYMGRKTLSDIENIAATYLSGISNEEIYHFQSIADIRYDQIDYLENEIKKRKASTVDEISDVVNEMGDFQNLASCALIAEDGTVETIYGDEIQSLDNVEYILSNMQSKNRVAIGGYSDKDQIIVWASPAKYPMHGGKYSVGILCCREMDIFVQRLHLNADGTLAYFHLLRPDGTYLINNSDTYEDNYFERILEHISADNAAPEELADELKECIKNGDIYSHSIVFKDGNKGINERRNMYGVPFPGSNWYLMSVVPYGVLDEIIADMGVARSRAMKLAVAILYSFIIALFVLYLGISMRQMKALEEARAQAEDSMIEAETSMEEATAARKDAENAREEADRANKAKSEFLSNMSHDIRTPMNAIIGMTSIARSHIDNRSQVEDCLKKISLSGKQLIGLINDILDMSKIESGKLTLNPEMLSLKETMETMCDIIKPQIKDKDQIFDIYIENIISENVYCDSIRLNQVLLNFLSNACKFTPNGGRIALSLKQEISEKGPGYVRNILCVEDNGIGMSKEFQDKIFKAFEREDNRRVNKIQGTGLGMAITKYIVDAMGGSIDVTSEEGKGSAFRVTLDLEKAGRSEEELLLPDIRILVVDDNEDLCRSAVMSLSELGTRADHCLDGSRAIEMVEKAIEEDTPYKVLLIDYKMDGMDGIETTRRIRQKLGDGIPISLISAYEWVDIEEEAREAGVNGFIPKPLFKSTLYHEIRKYIDDNGVRAGDEEVTESAECDLSGMRILLAEDQHINAVVANTLLTEAGAGVDIVEDGRQAVDAFSNAGEGYYDVILMDLRMPNMNGYEATVAIRALDREDAKKIPIIAMTADAFADDVRKCMDAGMNGHIAKPIDSELIKRTLSKYR